MVVDDKLVTKFPKLSMPVIIHMKEEEETCYVQCTFANLSSVDVVLEKHMVIVSLEPPGES